MILLSILELQKDCKQLPIYIKRKCTIRFYIKFIKRSLKINCGKYLAAKHAFGNFFLECSLQYYLIYLFNSNGKNDRKKNGHMYNNCANTKSTEVI